MIPVDMLNQWGASWTRFMWSTLVDSSMLLVALALLWMMVRRRTSPQFGYCLFLLVLVKLVVPVTITVPQEVASVLPHDRSDRVVSLTLP